MLNLILISLIIITTFLFLSYKRDVAFIKTNTRLKTFITMVTLTILVFSTNTDEYKAATRYYLTQETTFYENTDTYEAYGQIRKGEDIEIKDKALLDNDFIEIEYAGKTGFISTKNLSDEEVYVLSNKEAGMTAYMLTWEDPEYLLPETHTISKVDETTISTLLTYTATADMEDDYVIISDYSEILLPEDIINISYENGSEYLTFVVLNENTNKWHISVSIKTYPTESTEVKNIGFSITDTGLTLKDDTIPAENVIIGIHNNFNVSATQNGVKLTSFSQNYSTYFTLQSTQEIAFNGIVLTDGISLENTSAPENSAPEKDSGFSIFASEKEAINTAIKVLCGTFLVLLVIWIIFKKKIKMAILRKNKKLRKRSRGEEK